MGRKRKKDIQKKKKINEDILVVVLFVLTILLFILIYGESGALGEILSPALGGIIGWIKYLLPFGTAAAAIAIAKNDDNYMFSKIFQCMMFLACIAALLSIFQLNKSDAFKNGELTFDGAIESAYELGSKNIGGGTIGTVIAYPLISLLDVFGASVATIGVAVIILVFNFGLKPAEFLSAFIEENQRAKENRMQKAMEENRAKAEARANQKNKTMQVLADEDIGVDKNVQNKVLTECKFGGGCINDTVIHLASSNLGFGGLKQSGIGAYHGKTGFDTFTHYKSIVDKKNWIDMPMRYQPVSKFKYWLIKLFLK